MSARFFHSTVILLCWVFAVTAFAQPPRMPKSLFERHHPVWDEQGMVVASESIAARVGARILADGGNAVDAAVAVGFAEAVTLPRAGNLGGGGFMVIWLNEQKRAIAINYREKAPAKAHRDMFLDARGEVDRQRATRSLLASGVPGTVAGLVLAQREFGSLPLDRVMAPAIALAEQGFPVSKALADSLQRSRERFANAPATRAIFYHPDGSPYRSGEILVQQDLATSLKLIAEHGAEAFYEGPIADSIHRFMADNGGMITREDLANYRAQQMQPIEASFRGYRVLSMPPPSSGGVILTLLLNLLEPLPLEAMGHNSADTLHLMAESMALAYNDRNSALGDPDFVAMPIARLTSKAYADSLRGKIDRKRHTPSKEIADLTPGAPESVETTHFSVADRHGNLVANTYTLNGRFGNGQVVPGTGILLNNEMDDFAAKPGSPNMFGLVQGEANAVEPGKRPLSSMTPTVVLTPAGEPFLATGSPGGPTIITTVLQTLLNRLAFDMNIAQAVAAPRVHHQLWPDSLAYEEGVSPDTLSQLRARGHEVRQFFALGAAQSVEVDRDQGGFWGAMDPRKADSGAWGPMMLEAQEHVLDVLQGESEEAVLEE